MFKDIAFVCIRQIFQGAPTSSYLPESASSKYEAASGTAMAVLR